MISTTEMRAQGFHQQVIDLAVRCRNLNAEEAALMREVIAESQNRRPPRPVNALYRSELPKNVGVLAYYKCRCCGKINHSEFKCRQVERILMVEVIDDVQP